MLSNKFSKVTIIIPVFNAEKYIAETIQSVFNQSHQNWELIIINDGSTDSTESILKLFKDPRIKYLKQKNFGVSKARNRGLDIAKGEYITFLDADDILPQASLEKRVHCLMENPDYNLVDGHIIAKDHEMNVALRRYTPHYKGELLSQLLKLNDQVFFGVCYLFRRELIEGIRFNENMTHSEDLFFYIDMSSKYSVRYISVPEEVYWYRIGHESAMSNYSNLEKGYVQLIQSVKKIPDISAWKFLIFKAKIAKIMFLSWLSQKQFIKALKSPFYIFGIFSK